MCNPKPGVRCVNDTHKALVKSVENFVSVCETGDEGKITVAAQELNESRVFYYATNHAKIRPAEAKNTVKATLASVPEDFRGRLDDDEESRYVGRFLNNFQTVADKYRNGLQNAMDKYHTGNSVSSLDVARKMNNGGFDRVLDHGKKDNQNRRDERIGQALEETGSDFANPQTEEIEQEAALRERLLDKAHAYAMADAKKVIDRDIKKNSKTVDYPIDPRTVTYKKNVDGSFTITTDFKVKANSFVEAVDMADSTFGIEDVQTTLKPVEGKSDQWHITSVCLYSDSEDVADAEAFQKYELWKGSPSYRSAMA